MTVKGTEDTKKNRNHWVPDSGRKGIVRKVSRGRLSEIQESGARASEEDVYWEKDILCDKLFKYSYPYVTNPSDAFQLLFIETIIRNK